MDSTLAFAPLNLHLVVRTDSLLIDLPFPRLPPSPHVYAAGCRMLQLALGTHVAGGGQEADGHAEDLVQQLELSLQESREALEQEVALRGRIEVSHDEQRKALTDQVQAQGFFGTGRAGVVVCLRFELPSGHSLPLIFGEPESSGWVATLPKTRSVCAQSYA